MAYYIELCFAEMDNNGDWNHKYIVRPDAAFKKLFDEKPPDVIKYRDEHWTYRDVEPLDDHKDRYYYEKVSILEIGEMTNGPTYDATINVRNLPRVVDEKLNALATKQQRFKWEVIKSALEEYVMNHANELGA